jgi:hypothetical protein
MQFKCRPFLFALSALLALSCRCYADIATCHVVDPSGKPVSNVTVYLTDGNVNALVTKQTGGFSVDFGASRVQYALCTIVAPGYAPNGGPIQEGDNNFKLSLPISLTGKVVDTNGRIVVGAIIKAIGALTSYGQSNGQDMIPAATIKSMTFLVTVRLKLSLPIQNMSTWDKQPCLESGLLHRLLLRPALLLPAR